VRLQKGVFWTDEEPKRFRGGYKKTTERLQKKHILGIYGKKLDSQKISVRLQKKRFWTYEKKIRLSNTGQKHVRASSFPSVTAPVQPMSAARGE
jgi:hypothetical protein